MRLLLATLILAVAPAPAAAEMVMFSQRNFQGASYALTNDSSNVNFSPRSVRLLDTPWELCPRPFFGGNCIRVETSDPKLNLPRAFSGQVRSARKLAAGAAEAEKPAEVPKPVEAEKPSPPEKPEKAVDESAAKKDKPADPK
ncbi:beta/gamma crystallin-related protein [Sandaracinobacter sp. RS1-74]|uniref:beta/gamma crystallin-related protein n=1 Tax=Sandaracinobacteroides sayramensis TaxID=2913411 RepID=UPI001EDA9A98|nr:beta/gamma crystallin-related protein [Sandaracinobacteroides sayramensis]MCG2839625.1 beta/gamma crystallin-related protein [Sandaracinobacteroides sayramensis]